MWLCLVSITQELPYRITPSKLSAPLMSTLIILAVAIAILGLLASFALVRKGKPQEFPYEVKEALFSPAERSFLGALDTAAAPEYRVFGKVRIADVVEVRKFANKSRRAIAFNKISSKHFDFVICRANDLKLVCVVELDDKSHAGQKVQKRDRFVESVCAASELPLLRVPAKHAYTVADLKRELLQRVAPGTVTSNPAASPLSAVETSAENVHVQVPTCPKCASGMQLRQLTSGVKAGTSFWGCNEFPRCRGCIPA